MKQNHFFYLIMSRQNHIILKSTLEKCRGIDWFISAVQPVRRRNKTRQGFAALIPHHQKLVFQESIMSYRLQSCITIDFD
jgi:hypothetical protein